MNCTSELNFSSEENQYDREELFAQDKHNEVEVSNGKGKAFPKTSASSIDIYFQEIGYAPLLTAEKELELAYEVEKGNRKARQQMIESNLRLVIKIAKRYINCGLDLADLIEEGNLGLMLAVDKFKPALGFRFSTYATWWIRQSIEHSIMRHGRTIRLPFNVIRKLKRYKRKYAEMETAAKDLQHASSSIEEAAVEVDAFASVPVKNIKNMLHLDSEVVSIDSPISLDQQDTTFAELLEDENSVDPIRVLLDEDFSELVGKLIQRLEPQYVEVLVRRFGLCGYEPETLEQIAGELKLHREKVRQIQNNAFRRLRRIMLEEGLLE